MYIQELQIENFMPFRGVYKLKFRKGQIVNIIGQYEEEPLRSNRAGKSALFDAVCWCLYGKSRAKREIELVHSNRPECSVTVVLSDDRYQDPIRITRRRNMIGDGVKLEVSSHEGMSKQPTQELINKLVGLNYNEFITTAFFRQNDINQFMEAGSKDKKEILIQWLQTTAWGDYEQAALELKRKTIEKRNRIKASIEGLPEQTMTETEIKLEVQKISERLTTLYQELRVLSESRIKAELGIKDLEITLERRVELHKLEESIAKLQKKRPDETVFIGRYKELKELLAKYPEVSLLEFEDANRARDKSVREIATLSMRARMLRADAQKAKESRNGICPILKAQCSLVEPDISGIHSMEMEATALENRKSEHEGTQNESERIIKLYRAQDGWRNEITQLKSRLDTVVSIDDQIVDLEHKRAELAKKVPAAIDWHINAYKEKIKEIEKTSSEYRDEVKSLEQRRGELSKSLAILFHVKNKKDGYAKDLNDTEIELEDINYLCFAFSKNGIPSIELENSYGEIEDDANFILKKLRSPFHMQFDSVRALKEVETHCSACGIKFEKKTDKQCKLCGSAREYRQKDDLQIKILEGDQERQFYMDSGGGKVLLSTAIRIALTLLAKRKTGSAWGVLFLDEIFGQLDPVNRKLMTDLTSSVLLNTFGFDQLFIISHDPEIQSALSEKLIVHRHKEKWSEIFFG